MPCEFLDNPGIRMRRAFAIATLGLVMLVAPASATTFSADVFSGFAGGAGINNSPTPVLETGAIPVNGFGGSDSGTASSSQGHLGAFLTTFDSPGVGASASFRTDVIFTPTAGSTLTTIPVALNLSAAGSSTHTGFSYHSDWSLSGQIGPVFTFTIGSAIEGDTVSETTSHNATNIGFTSGGEVLINGHDTVAGRLTTSSVDVPVSSPVTIALMVTVGAFGGGEATGDFLHSFDFPLADIFTLPDGFTVNDPDMFIVNNDFVSPTAATPLPAALPLFASGLGALGLLGWRRKRKTAAATQ
jgi:hypothetical protein